MSRSEPRGIRRTIRRIAFGLEADAQTARFLHDLIESVFETESAPFRRGAVHGALRTAYPAGRAAGALFEPYAPLTP